MQAHSNGLKCSNGIFLLKKKPDSILIFIFLFLVMPFAKEIEYECLPEHFYFFRQVLSFSILLHPEEEQWRVDTYIML